MTIVQQDIEKRFGWLYNQIDSENMTDEIEMTFSKLSGVDL